ncbi:MAG: hypothetical protein GY750_20775 [Lentisphaerae bacterium]|nr:hypothetical protein [Lentisphaerota bacterium]
MNMLTNRVPFGLLTKEEQELFKTVRKPMMYNGTGRWSEVRNPSYAQDRIYRLKLKEGEWYYIEYSELIVVLKCVDSKGGDFIEYCFAIPNRIGWEYKESRLDECDVFRPATQEEIDSVKPQETFVDCEINWRGEGECAIPKTKHSVVTITSFPIGSIHEDWALSGYIYPNEIVHECPFNFEEDGTKIHEKATHARFVKVD